MPWCEYGCVAVDIVLDGCSDWVVGVAGVVLLVSFKLDDAAIAVVAGMCLGLGAVPACMAVRVATHRTWADNVSGGALVGCGGGCGCGCGGGGGGGGCGGGGGGGCGGGGGGGGGSGCSSGGCSGGGVSGGGIVACAGVFGVGFDTFVMLCWCVVLLSWCG